MADTLRIMFEEDGFPRALLTEEDRAQAVATGGIDAATEVTVYRENEIPAYLRADAVPELRALLGLADTAAVPDDPPAIAPIAPTPSPVAEKFGTFEGWAELSPRGQPTIEAADVVLWAKQRPDRSGAPRIKAVTPNPAMQPLHKYADFTGRSTRTELLSFALLEFLALGVTAALSTNAAIIGVLLLLIPNLALQVRRLHDGNITGWAVLIGLIPYIGWLVLLVMLLIPGSNGANRYGGNPR